MSVSTRVRLEFVRADTEDSRTIARVIGQENHETFVDWSPLVVPPSSSFTVTGFSVIHEVLIEVDGDVATVELTKAGPASFQMDVSRLYLADAGLTGLRIINPSSVNPLSVQVVVGGA